MSMETGLIVLGIHFTIFTIVGISMNLNWKKDFKTYYWKDHPESGILFFVLVLGLSPVIYILGSMLNF